MGTPQQTGSSVRSGTCTECSLPTTPTSGGSSQTMDSRDTPSGKTSLSLDTTRSATTTSCNGLFKNQWFGPGVPEVRPCGTLGAVPGIQGDKSATRGSPIGTATTKINTIPIHHCTLVGHDWNRMCYTY